MILKSLNHACRGFGKANEPGPPSKRLSVLSRLFAGRSGGFLVLGFGQNRGRIFAGCRPENQRPPNGVEIHRFLAGYRGSSGT